MQVIASLSIVSMLSVESVMFTPNDRVSCGMLEGLLMGYLLFAAFALF